MRIPRLAKTVLCLALAAARAGASDACTKVWALAEVVRNASTLDGRLVCVRALLRPLPMQDRSSPSLFVYEAVSVSRKDGSAPADRVGLVDWGKDLEIDESLYKPESERRLEEMASRCPAIPKGQVSFDAEFRAVVEYKKGLTARAYAALPPNLIRERPRRTDYTVEFVFLELLKAKAVCKE